MLGILTTSGLDSVQAPSMIDMQFCGDEAPEDLKRALYLRRTVGQRTLNKGNVLGGWNTKLS